MRGRHGRSGEDSGGIRGEVVGGLDLNAGGEEVELDTEVGPGGAEVVPVDCGNCEGFALGGGGVVDCKVLYTARVNTMGLCGGKLNYLRRNSRQQQRR